VRSHIVPIEIGPEGANETPLKTTPLDQLHKALGAKLVPFAGWCMPVQYPAGVLAEHLHCRDADGAALFDVSHMGQASLYGKGAAAALEALVPSDIIGLKPGRQRYTMLTNEAGGIIDDLMVANLPVTGGDQDHGERLFLVVNASRAAVDFTHFETHLPAHVRLERHEDRALLALQGPAAATVMARFSPAAAGLPFMGFVAITIAGVEYFISRSGYTGEDGFEISVPAAEAEALARKLLEQPEVKPAGLGARDSLRLEAGLCLYGADLDEVTTPVEAGLEWVIGARRRAEWNFIGAEPIRDHLTNGVTRLRVGIRPDGRAPARAGVAIVAPDGTEAGDITSGSFGPSVGAPIAMGYVRRDLAFVGAELSLLVRGKTLPARVVSLPFVPHRYRR
jgi:aminomethyltransferase